MAELVTWATRFNPEEQSAELAHLRSHLLEYTSEFERLEHNTEELAEAVSCLALQRQAPQSSPRLVQRLLLPLTREYRAAQTRRIELLEILQVAQRERDDAKGELARLTDLVTAKEQDLTRFGSYSRIEVDEELKRNCQELAIRAKRRDDLKARATAVDEAVKSPLAEWRRYQEDLEEREATVAHLTSELSQKEDDIAWLEHLDSEISNTSNSYERAMQHKKCEQRFGEGSPRRAISATREQIARLRSEIQTHKHQITGIRNDMIKTEKRIKTLAQRAARDVQSLVVDGTNCCYEADLFIGLNALIPLVDELATKFEVIVVFDASIRSRLQAEDSDLRSALPRAQVHVVASRAKADETILDIADAPTDWVISNDRFGEYRDKTAVREGRIIRHEIVRGRVLVHDLDIKTSCVEQTIGGQQ